MRPLLSLQVRIDNWIQQESQKVFVRKDFESFGAAARTLLSFLKGYQNLVERIRLMMIKAPYGEKY